MATTCDIETGVENQFAVADNAQSSLRSLRKNAGYAPRNMDKLWIDPHDYQDQLESAVV